MALKRLGVLKAPKNKNNWHDKSAKEIEEAFEVSKLHKELIQRTPNAFAKYKVIVNSGRPVDVEYLEVNGAYELLFGKPANKLIGKRRREIYPILEEEWYTAYERAMTTGKAETGYRYEVELKKFFKVSIVPINRDNIAVLITDITQEMKAQEVLAMGWTKVMEIRDVETQGHSERVVELVILLAKRLGIKGSALEYIRRGAILHDIGKIGLRDKLLFKKGVFTVEEREEMKKHPLYAKELLKSFMIQEILDIPVYHHEKWDGSGYPDGLKKEEIPLSARIFSVVDVWDALVSKRRYHKEWSYTKALDYIKSRSGKDFDPRVVEEFVEMMK